MWHVGETHWLCHIKVGWIRYTKNLPHIDVARGLIKGDGLDVNVETKNCMNHGLCLEI